MGALHSLSGVQFGSTRLDGGSLNTQAPAFGGINKFNRVEPYSASAIGVGETSIDHPLAYKSDTNNSYSKAMAWKQHGASLSYGKTNRGSTFDFSA